MIESARNSMTALGAIATCCLVMAGCAGVKHAKTAEPVATSVPAEAIVVAEPPEKAAPEVVQEASAETATIPQPTVTAPTVVVPSQAREPVRPAPKVAAAPPSAVAEAPAATPPAPRITPAKPPAKPPASAAALPVPPAVPKAATAPAPVASPPARAPLDLDSLGTRLKQTKAIGVLTKLSLKNQVDDLLAKFRAYHARQGAATLPELRRSYDMLLLKVLSLLQDSDPPLARDIVQSRAAIWGILADPKKFNEGSLMAGATT
jgi:hypothetical protein